MATQHQAVLLEEAVAELMAGGSAPETATTYVDGTFGRGGHSRRILDAMPDSATLIAFDKDPEAIAVGRQLASEDARFQILHDSFAAIHRAGTCLAGVLLDLGVSSPQLDDPRRGFSFSHDGPLDMRMNTATGITAAEFVNGAPEGELVRVFRDYGEERFAKRIAAAVIRTREDAPFETTGQLASVVSEANPAWEKHKHPATRVFQAIRIHINGELDDLIAALEAAVDNLAAGGRLVVISFHSLEDRIVKRFMRDKARGKALPRGVPVRGADLGQVLRLIGKARRASNAELERNPRARSAVMRVAERLS